MITTVWLLIVMTNTGVVLTPYRLLDKASCEQIATNIENAFAKRNRNVTAVCFEGR